MKTKIGTTVGAAVAGAVLCALALSGCHGKGGATTNGGAGAVGGAGAATTAAVANDAGPTSAPTGAAAVDSELNTVDQQLGAAGTDLAQATQSPSDGG